MRLQTRWRGLRQDSGQTMTEYALILATIAIVLGSFFTTAGTELETLVAKVGNLL